MAIIQQGNNPACKHEKTTPEEKAAFGLVPVYTSNCADCGEFLFRFPDETEVSKKDMENAFDQTSNLIKGKPTD
jgi:hypothetical protein